MAQIIWKPRAIRQLNAIIDYSVPEFGMVAFKTIRDWYCFIFSNVIGQVLFERTLLNELFDKPIINQNPEDDR